ncbi:MAG: hypothetical protein HWQ43_26670 [Nostoc sp. JL31]|uniref:hypothetical protein n=1 Tax=Nostoc sp. JL31 TaxID=2815395 RepID=UPI0025E4FA80|nr:hypothetical protein [Nostoc sp. JL31]MBN3892569.1 hypothetical protein [Nostoc sp. JL31]
MFGSLDVNCYLFHQRVTDKQNEKYQLTYKYLGESHFQFNGKEITQLLPAVLLLENLNLLQFLTPDVQLRGSDEKMVEFKALAVKHRHVIKNYLNVTISEKLTSIA